ncbi:MAG: outer membrane beta-barrel protein [Nanoarchaeota archaeon]
MKKITLLLSAFLVFATLKGYSQNTTESESLFNAKEFSLGLTTHKVLDQNYEANLYAGIGYSFTRNFLVEAEVPIYQKDSIAVDSVSFGALYRYPVFTYFSPYLRIGVDYNWDNSDWDGYGGIGVSARIVKSWEIFSDINYSLEDFNNLSDGHFFVRGGIRLVF